MSRTAEAVKGAQGAKKPDSSKKPEKKKGGKKKLLFIVLPLLLVVAGAAYFLLFSGGSSKASATVATPPPTYNFSSLTTNLSDGHVLQVGMTFQLSRTSTPAEVTADLPQVTDIVIQTFAGYTYPYLLNPQSRDIAKQVLLKAINAELARTPKKPKVNAIFFTTFLMQ
ncbi:MAG: flagellar basal body-associated FliL family protein [Acidimicrobiaceae bacterium]|nr:flagellar basal body-associated FliL family protein [Acidimicrobiaceae bacterium]